MKAIFPILDDSSKTPLYMQIYEQLRYFILQGNISYKEKLPSLRSLSSQLKVSVSTVDLAYSQLLVEGYVISKANSGYYVDYDISKHDTTTLSFDIEQTQHIPLNLSYINSADETISSDMYDTTSFDFSKWKKCINKVLNYHPHLLLFESNPQGEKALRVEIAKYIYTSRGVSCDDNQIFISAGTQQITSHISKLLKTLNISNVCVENPGYVPVSKIFSDNGFQIKQIPVLDNGIDIQALPINISSAIYVSPSNQFPTGAVMPIGRRHSLLKWAKDNSSYIIEDDYDSELRYFGRPIPPVHSLDKNDRVIYLGSFSSTLFPAIKISYMVIPKQLTSSFKEITSNYSQTCSKTEQLALALFMQDGKYMQNIKKLRRSYSQKLENIISSINKFDETKMIDIKNTYSGITILMKVRNFISASRLCEDAEKVGLNIIVSPTNNDSSPYCDLIFYYNTIPFNKIEDLISKLISAWNKLQ